MKMRNMIGLNPRVNRAPASKDVRTRKRQTPENFFLFIRKAINFGLISSGIRPSGFTVESIVSIFGCTPKWINERKLVRRINATILINSVQSEIREAHSKPLIRIRRRPVMRITVR